MLGPVGLYRDIDIALNAHASKLYHMGIHQCPKSTLADANERRDWRTYEEFAKSLMHRERREYAVSARSFSAGFLRTAPHGTALALSWWLASNTLTVVLPQGTSTP